MLDVTAVQTMLCYEAEMLAGYWDDFWSGQPQDVFSGRAILLFGICSWVGPQVVPRS
jgi:hypothetical protein